jgi:Bacterial antitoxin of type II TA system, VapB
MIGVQPLYVESPLLELALHLTHCQTPEEVVKLALQELVRYRQPPPLSLSAEARRQSLLASAYSSTEEELWLANQDETGWK